MITLAMFLAELVKTCLVLALVYALIRRKVIKNTYLELVRTVESVVLVSRYLAPKIAEQQGTVADLADQLLQTERMHQARPTITTAEKPSSKNAEEDQATADAMDTGPCWDALQKELLQAVFSRLTSNEDSRNVRLVSRTWHSSITESIRRLELPVIMPDQETTQHLLSRLPSAFQCATHLVLHNNQTCHPNCTRDVLLQVGACQQIRALDLRDSEYWTTMWDLACISSLRHLTSLSLSFQVVDRAVNTTPSSPVIGLQCSAVSALTGLHQLRVWFMGADEEGQYLHAPFFVALTCLPHLQNLTLNCALVTDEAVACLLQMPALKSLTLYGKFLGPTIEALASAPHLKRLELSQHTDPAEEAAAGGGDGGGQPWLNAAAAVAGVANAAALAGWAAEAADMAAAVAASGGIAEGGAPGSVLTYLQLPLTPEALRLGPLVPQMTALRRLFVQEPLEHDAFRPFSYFLPRITLPPLHELFIDGFLAVDPSPLEALAHLTTLTSLTLCNSSLPGDLYSAITVLSTLTCIEDFVLDLEDPGVVSPVSDQLVMGLASNWPKLISLHLDTHIASPSDPDIPVTEVHLSCFSAFTTLQNLSLHHTGPAYLYLACSSLPPSALALNAYGLILVEPYLLPPTLHHLRASNYCSLHPSDVFVLSRHLTNLRTLMLKKDPSWDPHPLVTPSNLPFLTALSSLQSLALSLSGPQPITALSSLTSLTRLLLDQDAGLPAMTVDSAAWYSQLMQLTTLTRLRSLWLSENLVLPAPYDTLLRWQDQLQQYMPLCVLQLVENDRFWTTDIIMNEAVDWWACCAWPSFDFSEREI